LNAQASVLGAVNGVDAVRPKKGSATGSTTDVIIIVIMLLVLLYGLSHLYD
jgi:hypothetical protein